MDDSVQVKCTRCKSAFRERARRLQNGYSRQCVTCEVVMFFDEDSPDANIKKAMRMARRVRKELREAEAEFRPRMMSRRGSARHATDDENVAGSVAAEPQSAA
jgi:predicted  nucleic acid-binding Zn-ribbon protein